MIQQPRFLLGNRNPDVLSCIANLSNDEVFTPPELANRMLDTLAEAWAQSHGGASIWADPNVRFLDPCTKSGVFLREITSRLNKGLAEQMPDVKKRVEHILTKQVFGIAITNLTSLLARRSLYCSKFAKGKHSVVQSFKSDAGNIWFERTEHTWVDGKCKYCGANERDYGCGADRETHAYAFIHTENLSRRLREMFGAKMQFDVIIGNPPYQLGQSGGDAVGSFAMPIYQDFVDAAKRVSPRFVVMVTPSRWFAGGRSLDRFRETMLSDHRLRALVDFPESRDVFPGVDIAGGISYFLWDSEWQGTCTVTSMSGGHVRSQAARQLGEHDIFIRWNEAIPILHRVLAPVDGQAFASIASRVSPIQPFSIRTHFRGAESPKGMADPVVIYQSGGTAFIERSAIPRNTEWVDQWKVIVSMAVPAGGRPDKEGRYYGLIGIRVLPPGTACTETYLVVNRLKSKREAVNFSAFLRTKFVRFLVWLRTNTQHLYSERFAFVPELPMDCEWTDTLLYKRYGLTAVEVDFIESMIRPVDPSDE